MKTSVRYTQERHESHAWLKILVGVGVAILAVGLSSRIDILCAMYALWDTAAGFLRS